MPKGFELLLPVKESVDYAVLYDGIPKKNKFSTQKFGDYYKVRRGENLSYISKKLGVSFSELIRLNNIRNPNRIRTGQRLKIPVSLSYKPTREEQEAKDVSIMVIYVKDNETISHFSDWSNSSIRSMMQINNLSNRSRIHYGQKILISLSKVNEDEFLEERDEFHKDIEEKFFEENRVKEISRHRVKSGENIWYIVQRFNAPLWLVEKHNEGRRLSNIKKGDILNIPLIEKISNAGTDQ